MHIVYVNVNIFKGIIYPCMFLPFTDHLNSCFRLDPFEAILFWSSHVLFSANSSHYDCIYGEVAEFVNVI